MATRTYFLKKGQGLITLKVSPATIGIASSSAQLKKSGGTSTDVGDSGNDASGTIKKRQLGKSSDILSSVLVVTTMVDLADVPEDQWQQAFDTFRVSYQLDGGADGSQDFNIDNDDKIAIQKGKFIIAGKAIKFDIHEVQ